MPKRTHRNPDHVRRHNQPSPNNQAIANQLEALLSPAIFARASSLPSVGVTRSPIKSAVNDGSGVDSVVEASSGCTRVKEVAVKKYPSRGLSDLSLGLKDLYDGWDIF